jgi:GPH family glycoside/pentoside/hexuronide:cation symporter
VAAIILFVITFLMTKERVQPIAKEKTPLKDDLKDIVKNVPWMVLFAATILFILFVCIRLSVTAHYFKYFIGEQEFSFFSGPKKYGFETLASVFNTIGQSCSLIGVLLVPWFAKLVGRKRALVILMVVSLFSTGIFYFFKPDNLWLIFTFQAIGSLAGGPISALLWVLYADTADYSEWKTGRRATGLVFSASIMSNKIGWTVGTLIAGLILATTGFVPNIAQNIEVRNGLKAMMSVIPLVAGIFTLAILMLFYKLDEPLMEKVKAELDERRKAQEAAEGKMASA